MTLQKFLGYFNNIFWLSQLHQCDQRMLFVQLDASSLVKISFSSEDLFGYIPGISTVAWHDGYEQGSSL